MALSILHHFQSAKADGGDSTLVQPSYWNAQHDITLANQRVMGRNTAGSGAVEEVTASQLLDWVSNTNGVLLTRTAGTWGAPANVTTDNGDLVLANNTSPVAPAAGSKVFSQLVGGRPMLGVLPSLGAAYQVQPSFARKRIILWSPQAALTTFTVVGGFASTIGTPTSRVPASTNLCTSATRLGLVSAAGAGSSTGMRDNAANAFWRGNAAGLGGFHFVMRFAISDAVLVATANMFVGIHATAAPSDVAPSTLTNLVGVGCDNGDTVLQLYAAGSAAQARVSLGANFPANTINTDVYELILFAIPNGSDIRWMVNRLNTGDTASGTISAGASLFSTTQFFGPYWYRSNGGTASAVGLDMILMYGEAEV